MTQDTVIKLHNVAIVQQNCPVLVNVNLQVRKGDFVWLIGRTGSGKSSLLKVIYGDLAIAQGKGYAGGCDLKQLTENDVPFLRRQLGIIFQDLQLLMNRSIEDNLTFAMKATGWKHKSFIKERMQEVLKKVGLASKIKKMPYELSAGEQQKVVIARSLINHPAIILADEPTGNLDPEAAEEITMLLKEISLLGTAVLVATHNYHMIRMFPARIIKCINGALIEGDQVTS